MYGKIQIVTRSTLSYAATRLKSWHSVSLVTLKFSVPNFFESRVFLKIFDADFPIKTIILNHFAY